MKKGLLFIVFLLLCLTTATVFAEEKTLTAVLSGSDILSLDPSILGEVQARQVAHEIYGGLVFMDEETNEVYPHLAKSWDISEDGTVYTFHLRDDVPWVKYDPKTGEINKTDRVVTAEDFRYGFIRTLEPSIASQYAYLDAWNIAGAAEYNNGGGDPSVIGVKALDEFTLEVKLIQPAAYNIAIIGMSMNYAQPAWAIEEYGDKWTEAGNIETYGPYTLKEWIHDDRITLLKNPYYPGTEGVHQANIDTLSLLFRDSAAAMSEYEAGNIDWVEVPSADIERVQNDSELSKEFVTSERACSEYYILNTKSEFTDDLRVRKALSYSINRQDLVDYVTKTGEQPAKTQIHPSLPGAPDIDKLAGPIYDPDFAREQLNDYLTEKGLKAEDIVLTLQFNSNTKVQMVAEACQQMWKDELGITVNVEAIESKVYWALTDTPELSQIARISWCPDYFDSTNFIRDAFRTGGMNNEIDENGQPYGGVRWYNEEFDKLVDAAAAEIDNDKRIEMYTRAEEIIGQEDVVFIPLYYFSYAGLTKPYVSRTYSVGGVQAYEKWDITK